MKRERALVSLLFALTVSGTLNCIEARPADDEETKDISQDGAIMKQGTEDSGTAGSGGGFWANRRPCSCANSRCGCCTGTIFPLPEFLRQTACMNFTYIEDEFALKMAIILNNQVMYNNKVSGRNPRPICVSPPRLSRAQLCVKLHDVFLIERNMHACVNVEGLYNKKVMFGGTMGCMRVGANGFAIVRPEDGGGLPSVEPADPDDEEPDEDEDYDQVDEEADEPEVDQPAADSPDDNNVETEANGEGTKGLGGEEKVREEGVRDKIVGVGTVEEV